MEQVFNLFVKFALADGNGAARTGCARALEREVGQARADLEVCTTSWFNLFVKFALSDGKGAALTGCELTLEWEVGQVRADLEVCTTSWFLICS